MKKIVFYLILISFSLISCNKDINEKEPEVVLPTGENTMYYYIDNALYIPKSQNIGGSLSPAISYSVCDIDEPTFDLTTLNFVLFFYNGIQEEGTIILNQSNRDSCQTTDNNAFYFTSEEWDDGIFHSTAYYTRDGTGEVNITYLSEDKRKFEGTFRMTVYHMNTGVTKEITNGHFNINLDTL